MKRHHRPAALLALGVAFAAGPSSADGAPPTETTHVVVVDVDTLPKGELPTTPDDHDAPTGVPAFTQPATVTVTTVADERPKRRLRKPNVRASKGSSIRKSTPQRIKLVEISPSSPSLDAMYSPATDAPDVETTAVQKMSCGDRESVTPLRWETLATTADGDARLEVRDLWFDAKTCAVGPGTTTTLALKAIAWDGGKPWLYAMRSDAGVTVVMPHANELSSESMVGIPVSVRADFTRVTMPVGRWGSGSIVAQLASLSARPVGQTAGDGEDHPVEVGIELVQTMSEKSPTLLIRTRQADAATSDEGAGARRESMVE